MNAPSKIALFGGTFDPVHCGHLEAAEKARNTLQLDQLIFIPCRQSPHKHKSPGASDQDRSKMLRLATEDLPWAKVDDYELQQPPPSYTWETVSHFKSISPPGVRFFLLIGLDQWESLPRWNQIERLAANVCFIVVGRSGHPKPKEGFEAVFIEGNHPASASQIRSDLRKGLSAKWLPPKVADYIEQKALYSVTQ